MGLEESPEFARWYTHDVIAQHGVLESGVGFIAKPFGPDALALKVRQMLEASE
jgi:hypothetical protein